MSNNALFFKLSSDTPRGAHWTLDPSALTGYEDHGIVPLGTTERFRAYDYLKPGRNAVKRSRSVLLMRHHSDSAAFQSAHGAAMKRHHDEVDARASSPPLTSGVIEAPMTFIQTPRPLLHSMSADTIPFAPGDQHAPLPTIHDHAARHLRQHFSASKSRPLFGTNADSVTRSRSPIQIALLRRASISAIPPRSASDGEQDQPFH